MFIHTAFICNRGTQLFENKLTNNGFVAIVVLVGIANFFVWSQQDVKALEHDCGHADYYETFAEEKESIRSDGDTGHVVYKEASFLILPIALILSLWASGLANR